MGLFQSTTACPACGAHGARKTLWWYRCPNRECKHYSPEVRMEQSDEVAATSTPASPAPPAPSPALRGSFEPPADFRIELGYTNFRGEHKRFVGDARTLRRRGNHVSLCVVPTGYRITLSVDRLDDVPQLEEAVAEHPEPRGVDLQILSYHHKNGTTSPRHREVSAAFPHWQP